MILYNLTRKIPLFHHRHLT